MKEIYKDICGYEGRYQISNFGNVKSLNYQNTKKPSVLIPIKHYLGYLLVHLGQDKIRMIHTLVAEAFIPRIEGKEYVNHIDGNKQNNNVKNLEWVTKKENTEHAIRMGLRDPHAKHNPCGEKNHSSKPILQLSKDGQLIKKWGCISDAARYIGCKPASITNNAMGRTKTLHGFLWRYE